MEKKLALREPSRQSIKNQSLSCSTPFEMSSIQQQPVFIVPSPNAFQQLDIIKQQIETLEHTIRQAEATDQDVAKSTRESLAFLRAQHENLLLWQRSMIPQTFPPGMIYVAPGGQTYYHMRLPDASGMQEGAFIRSMRENASIQGARPPVSPVHIPKIPSIEPIKTLQYPTRRSSRPKKAAGTEVTVTIRTRDGKDPVVKASASPAKPQQEKFKKRQDRARKSEALAGLNPFQDAVVAKGHAIPRPPQNGRQIDGNWVIDEANDSVRINGRLYTPELFFWLTDPNGNKFFVCIPFSKWDPDDQCWVMRILFSNGTASLYRGTTTNGRFEAVRNLQKLVDPLLARLWYVKVSLHGMFVHKKKSVFQLTRRPKHSPPPRSPRRRSTFASPTPCTTRSPRSSTATSRVIPSSSGARRTSAPMSRTSTPSRTGSASIWSSRRPRMSRTSWWTASSRSWLPSESRRSCPRASAGIPFIRRTSACPLLLLTLVPHPPDMSARWWDRLDMSNPSESPNYWPPPCGFWQAGHLVTVPTSVLDLSRYWPLYDMPGDGIR